MALYHAVYIKQKLLVHSNSENRYNIQSLLFKIFWAKQRFGHETQIAETETKRCSASGDRLETETSRPRPHPCQYSTVNIKN